MGEHGEVTVKVIKKKEKGKVAVTKVPMATPVVTDESTPAQGMRKRRHSRDDREQED